MIYKYKSQQFKYNSPPNICETVRVSAVTLEEQRGARPYADSSSGDHELHEGHSYSGEWDSCSGASPPQPLPLHSVKS